MKTDTRENAAAPGGRDLEDGPARSSRTARDGQDDEPWFRHIPSATPLPVAAAVSGRRPSLVWLVPVLVVVLGGWLALRAARERGPTVTITFATADGLEANKTTVRYRGVVVGMVKSIALPVDRPGIVASVELSKQMTAMLVEDARFWVVRPRVSVGGVSGINTLLAGAQIAFDRGVSSRVSRAFVGLETEPSTSSDRRGRRISLRADTLGSLEVGSPVYYRRVRVGQVTRTALEPGGQAVAVEAFVDAPYDLQIDSNTRFWNASGVDVTVDMHGLRIDTQSVTSILAGGIAFETPPRVGPLAPSESPGGTFQVFASRDAAFRGAISSLDDFRLVFARPIRGLASGAPVELFGWEVGEVREVGVELDGTTGDPRTIVVINLRPDRFAVRTPGLAAASSAEPTSVDSAGPTSEAGMRRVLARLVNRGLRAEVRTGNILTNQRYVALERVPGAGPVRVDWTAVPVTLPTSGDLPGGLAESIEQLVSAIDKLPLDRFTREATSTATEMRRTLENTSTLIAQVDGNLVPRLDAMLAESQKTLGAVERTLAADSPLQREVQGTLRELAGAGQAVRVLAQSLDDHPESLVWGKKKRHK